VVLSPRRPAHRVGEPFGALRLAVAVTVVEVALIVSMMIGTSGSEALAAIQCSPLS
jgi:Ca2+:H+ antiporter